MAAGRVRSTRRLRTWIIEQVSSGKYPGLMWDDEAKTMFRIPWKHAGKQDFRKDEDAAIFKAWAEFKGKLTDGDQENPASWKTRLRCALNKSPEFMEVMERAQLDISEPYKVYRLVPICEQGVVAPEKKCRVKATKRVKGRKSSDSESDDVTPVKQLKAEEVASQLVNISQDVVDVYLGDLSIMAEEGSSTDNPRDVVDEITLDVRIEENVPVLTEVQESFSVVIYYLGHVVHSRQIQGADVRITYMPPSSAIPPIPDVLKARFPRIQLPEPPSTLPAGQQLQALSTLLPYMEKGVVLTSSQQGVYGTRYCQGRVFWTGPHTTTPGLHKMERNMKPALLFSKETFIQQLNHFLSDGGEPPQCSITLCFGEVLSNTEDPSEKLIIVQITLPWAEQMVQNTQTLNILQTLASQSPQGEITLNLVTVSNEAINCSL